MSTNTMAGVVVTELATSTTESSSTTPSTSCVPSSSASLSPSSQGGGMVAASPNDDGLVVEEGCSSGLMTGALLTVKVQGGGRQRFDVCLWSRLATSHSDLALSKSRVQALIKGGSVLVNATPVTKCGANVKDGDVIVVSLDDLRSVSKAVTDARPLIQPEDIPLNIVWEDDCLLVVNKGQGMVVHPAPESGTHYSGTLVNALLHYPGLAHLSTIDARRSSSDPTLIRPGIVHRIDRDTSGIMVVAKTDDAHLKLKSQFQKHTITRQYHAIVEGLVTRDEGTLDTYIGRHPVHRKLRAVILNYRPSSPPPSPSVKGGGDRDNRGVGGTSGDKGKGGARAGKGPVSRQEQAFSTGKESVTPPAFVPMTTLELKQGSARSSASASSRGSGSGSGSANKANKAVRKGGEKGGGGGSSGGSGGSGGGNARDKKGGRRRGDEDDMPPREDDHAKEDSLHSRSMAVVSVNGAGKRSRGTADTVKVLSKEAVSRSLSSAVTSDKKADDGEGHHNPNESGGDDGHSDDADDDENEDADGDGGEEDSDGGGRSGRKSKQSGPARAITHYRVIERFGESKTGAGFTHVECTLETGKTHQIRVHMKHLGHTLVNDVEYGARPLAAGKTKSPLSIKLAQVLHDHNTPGQLLHARVLGLVHPGTGTQVRFEAPLPPHFDAVLSALREVSASARLTAAAAVDEVESPEL